MTFVAEKGVDHEISIGIGIRAVGGSAGGYRGALRGARAGREGCDAAGSDRVGKDLHYGQRHREAPEAGADPEPQQDAGGAALRGVQKLLPVQCR